jgi:RNA polymerase sigma-70 factor (ECF subfamily)
MENTKSSDIAADLLMETEGTNRRLKREVNGLKWHYKAVVVLHYFEERSIRDVSEVLKIPEGTVKSRLAKARSILKERMEDHYE